jgi:hypothetical protein
MKGRLAAVAAAVALVLTGCASNGNGGGAKISAAAAAALAPYIQAVRTAATAKHPGPMDSAISQLRNEVTILQQAGKLSASRAANIDNAADALLTDFKAGLPTPSATPSTATPTPSSATPTPTPTVTVTVTPTTSTTPTQSGSTTASP